MRPAEWMSYPSANILQLQLNEQWQKWLHLTGMTNIQEYFFVIYFLIAVNKFQAKVIVRRKNICIEKNFFRKFLKLCLKKLIYCK